MTTGLQIPNDFIRFFMIGVNGERWAFGAKHCPVRLHTPPTGLQGAPVEHDFQDIVGGEGALYRATRDLQAEITLQLWVADPRSSAWARQQHAAWRQSLGRGKDTVRLYAVTRESGYWWIDLRLSNVGEADYFDQYPGRVGEIGETVTFVSDHSFWRGFEETKIFDRDTCLTASLINQGDQPAWLRYTITGQHDGVGIGVGDEIIHLPPMANGNGYYIDTEESWPALMDITGEDIQEDHPAAYWRVPLPGRGRHRGTSVPINIKPKNAGPDFRVEVAYTPRTEQAW